MIHISELSWNRIKHPSEVVNVGDTVEVTIKKLDKKETYWVKARAYKVVNGSKKYGAWSKVKKVKIKK